MLFRWSERNGLTRGSQVITIAGDLPGLNAGWRESGWRSREWRRAWDLNPGDLSAHWLSGPVPSAVLGHVSLKLVPEAGVEPAASTDLNRRGLPVAYPGMASPEGLEPSTLGIEIRCSVQLNYGE